MFTACCIDHSREDVLHFTPASAAQLHRSPQQRTGSHPVQQGTSQIIQITVSCSWRPAAAEQLDGFICSAVRILPLLLQSSNPSVQLLR